MLGRSDPALPNSYSLPAMPSFSVAASLPMQVRLCSSLMIVHKLYGEYLPNEMTAIIT